MSAACTTCALEKDAKYFMRLELGQLGFEETIPMSCSVLNHHYRKRLKGYVILGCDCELCQSARAFHKSQEVRA